MPDSLAHIADNVAAVRGRIADAARRAGRIAADVTLVAVSKYVGAVEVRALVAAGCTVLGESRPQDLWEKAALLGDLPIRWHLIGHLQRNKVRRTLPLVEMIHSADSPALIEAVDRIAAELALKVPLLLEVNISGDETKHGFAPDAVESNFQTWSGYRHVAIRGLMGMSGLESGPDAARAEFAALRALRDRLRANCPEGIAMDELSMGMSQDYEIAVEEGATIVRVGSALFEGVVP